jgi:hypothetical protein
MLPCIPSKKPFVIFTVISKLTRSQTSAMPRSRILSTSCLNEKDKTEENRVLLRRSKSFSYSDGLVILGEVLGSPSISDHSYYMSGVHYCVCLPEPSYYKRGSPGVTSAAEAKISRIRSSCRASYNFQVGLEIRCISVLIAKLSNLSHLAEKILQRNVTSAKGCYYTQCILYKTCLRFL